ncbi:MAG: hypothetical protein ABEI58_03585 [Candidatus Nanohaloarchaea archaeon]
MSSHGEPGETCHFGHVFDVWDHGDMGTPGDLGEEGAEIRGAIKNGEIRDLSELEEETGTDFLRPIMGDYYKSLKVSAGSQGTPYLVSWACADKFDEDLDYEVSRTQEKISISPQSHLHGEFSQRKQQAEQNVRETMRNLSELRKQKHMLEHDIRKLRSRAEDFETGDETQLKADFVELVDGAGGGQQGGDEAALKFLRDQNLYPSIVADFNEMESLDDLEGDGKLADLPANEKAILRKKYTMYEKWKDLYGSEVHRKLNDLKSQLKSIERSIEETENWLEPYVKDMVTIEQKTTDDLAEDINRYMTLTGSSTMYRDMEFICYRPLKNEGGQLQVIKDDEDTEPTHYRIVLIHSVHVNIAGGEEPQSPAGGPSAAKVFWFPAIVCKHVFENFFQAKIEKSQNRFKQLLKDYTGELETEAGDALREARNDKNLAIREIREKVGEELGEDPPIQFSSYLRRVEDGIDQPEVLADEFGEEYLEALKTVLEVDLGEDEEGPDDEMYTGLDRKLREFTGQIDEFVVPPDADPLGELLMEIKFKYYYDFKIGLGLYTMK